MNSVLFHLIRVPIVVVVIWAALSTVVPIAMTQYAPFQLRPGIRCISGPQSTVFAGGVPVSTVGGANVCLSLADLYHRPFLELFVDAMFRSLALLGAAAVLAITVGTLIGVAAALMRRRAFASGGIIALTSLLTAVPAFFVAYFLQIVVIVLGSSVIAEGGRLLPVYGFGYDEHLVLPLLSISLPAIAYTAQLTATRMQDVLDSDFINVANAKGLRTSWILSVHVLPHVRPVLLEALGSGLRVSVASLPIVEFLFNWGGIGELALAAVGVKDAPGFVFTAVVLAGLFATLSTIADLSRPRALYRPT
jgi:peptide/nickel transport system permease protein